MVFGGQRRERWFLFGFFGVIEWSDFFIGELGLSDLPRCLGVHVWLGSLCFAIPLGVFDSNSNFL